jgi:hypothetical protein
MSDIYVHVHGNLYRKVRAHGQPDRRLMNQPLVTMQAVQHTAPEPPHTLDLIVQRQEAIRTNAVLPAASAPAKSTLPSSTCRHCHLVLCRCQVATPTDPLALIVQRQKDIGMR